MVSHGRDRDDGFRNPRVAEASPHRSEVEARRTPPRVRPLMEIVGSDEQVACMGFALSSAALEPCGQRCEVEVIQVRVKEQRDESRPPDGKSNTG